ncbi:MAG: ATP-grasp domain-containing protein [Acidobacteriota bacterium]|nr:ATP-grasp domain-containing protein [Acidobacteriota bacterium]
MAKPLTLMRTAAGTPICVSQIQRLQEAGVRVVAVDCDALSVGFAFADAAFCVPPVKCAGYVDNLLKLAVREGVDWIMPALDEELLLLASARERFEAVGTRLLLSNVEALRVCTDKLSTFEFFRDHGIPTPETIPLSDLNDAESVGQYPLILKPRSGRGSQGIHVVRSFQEACAIRSHMDHGVAQRYIDGVEYTTDVLATPERTLICTRRRIMTDSGICSKAAIECHPDIEHWVRTIAQKLNLFGPANVQCFVTPKGEVLFTEINARIAGSSILSIEAGARILDGLLAIMRGEELTVKSKIEDNLIMLRYWSEVYVTPDQAAQWNLQ